MWSKRVLQLLGADAKKFGDGQEREPVPGKKVWHPPADQSVYLWHVACENCDVFETKSTKVLSDDIRMTG